MELLDKVRLLTVKQVAEKIPELKEPSIYDAIRSDVFPHVKIGRRVFVEEAVLVAWIKAGGTALRGGWRKAQKSDDEAQPAGDR